MVTATAHATVANVSVKTDQATAITIDLRNDITNITVVINVQVASSPTAGNTAVPVACTDTTNRCILYTPAAAYTGVDTFNYSVVNDVGATEIATISVTVGNATTNTTGLVPDTQIENLLENDICQGTPTGDLQTICTILSTTAAGSEDRRILLKAITPADVAAQGSMGELMASGQLNNVARHLASLRNAQNQVSVGGLAFNQDEAKMDGNLLAKLLSGEESGGSAGAGSSGRLGWFINGDIGTGTQDETLFEDGFDFSNGTLSTGVDYRLGAGGVIGVAYGISKTSLDMMYDTGGMDASSHSVTTYGSLYPSRESYVDIIFSANFTSFKSERRIIFGTTNELANSENDSTAMALRLATGLNLIQSGAFTTTLDLKGEYIRSTIDGYSETGDSIFNVTISEREVSQLRSMLGTTMTYAISTGSGVVIPQVDLVWVYQFEDEANLVEGYFNADPNQTKFKFDSNTPDTSFIELGFSLSTTIPGGTTGFIQLGSTILRDNYENNRLALGIRLEL